MTGYPERYIVFDTETYEKASDRKGWHKEQWLRLGMCKVYDPVSVVGNKPLYHGFKTSKEFMQLINVMPYASKAIYVFAHNLGFDVRIVEWLRALANKEFDLLPPPSMPNAKRYQKRLFVMDGYPFMMRLWRPDGQQFVLIDSFNWLPVRLAQVGEWLGFPKGQMPTDDAPEADWYEYCQRDVDVLDRALRRLWGWMQSIRITHFSYTPAAISAQIYKMRFAKQRIVRPKDDAVLKLDRMGYYGGRIDAFRVGYIEEPTYQLDVNSLYPRVMLDHPYPCEVLDHGDSQGSVPAAILDSPQVHTAEVLIESPQVAWPVRGRDGTLYVRGRLRTVLCGPELQRAVECACVRGVYRWVSFKCIDLFSQWVREYWKIRAQAQARGDELTSKVVKSILNSLHGKFGQRDGEWRYQGPTMVEGGYGGGKVLGPNIHDDVEYRIINGELWYRCRDHEHEQAFVPIAAWTSSYARIYMYEMMKVAGVKNVHYLCVDSMLVNREGYDALCAAGKVDESRLGALKLEDTYSWIDLQAHHQMDHDHGWKHSGIKRDARRMGDGVYEFEEWSSCGQDLESGDVSSVATRDVIRRPTTHYYQRYVNPDRTTTPWAIDNAALTPEAQREVTVLSNRYAAE